jgi:hypothetical protein
MKVQISFLFILLGLSSLLAGDTLTLSEARTLAQKEKRPVLIEFWSDN